MKPTISLVGLVPFCHPIISESSTHLHLKVNGLMYAFSRIGRERSEFRLLLRQSLSLHGWNWRPKQGKFQKFSDLRISVATSEEKVHSAFWDRVLWTGSEHREFCSNWCPTLSYQCSASKSEQHFPAQLRGYRQHTNLVVLADPSWEREDALAWPRW